MDAIDREDMDALYDELGDVLLQIVLHAEIAREHGEFTIEDVTTAITHKMIFRHQHVFGSAKADTADEVLDLWQKVKKAERHQKTQAEVLRSRDQEPAGADARGKGAEARRGRGL